MITAEVHSDDRVVAADFDATPWFASASRGAIVELARCGWGGREPADRVALFMQEHDPKVGKVFDYLEAPRQGGFECEVEGDEAVAWLRANRPDVLPIRFLAIALMDDEDGISEEAWGILRDLLVSEGSDDIVDQVMGANNRFYLSV